MRSFARVGLLVALFLTAASVSAREQFRLPASRPTSIKEVADAMRGNDPETSIPAYLEGAQCGGWNKNISAGTYIADVWGLPGRPHKWDGDIPSGKGVRVDGDDADTDPDNEFEYPRETEGLTTVCAAYTDRITKIVWAAAHKWITIDGEVVFEYKPDAHEYAHPYFENPACRWRFQGGGWPEVPLRPLDGADPPRSDKNSWETEDPDSCINFCGYLNSFVYADCMEVVPREIQIPDVDADGNPVVSTITINTCAREAYRYLCTDIEVDEEEWEASCFVPYPEQDEWSNSRKCEGSQCRCPQKDDPDACVWVNEENNVYQSYFRWYTDAGYRRSSLGDAGVPNDQSEKNFQAACYGFYEEFDPKTRQTSGWDRRCVINVDVENMRETQLGKGEYQEGSVVDKDPTDTNNQRPGGISNAPGEFDKEEDTWYKKLGGAISFVNEKLFKDQYDSDLGNVFLAFDELDNGDLKATPQINDTEDGRLAESNLMRAFDDTGNPRAFVRWWQEQQTRMAALMRPPVLRIVLPSAWFMGLDPDDPFLNAVSDAPAGAERPDRSDRIELQIEADEDVLGTALAYLERSVLLHVEEEPIPIIVPAGSPVEFRARAADWCTWYKNEHNEKTCDDAPEDIKELMERLEEYAQRIDDYRELRAELAETAGAILDLQHRLLEPIAKWFKDNEQRLRDIVRGRDRVERDLLPIWNEAQASIARLHERSNLPWCMNQRFTAPVYSLLDRWLPSRAFDGATDERGLPLLPIVKRPEDVIIDFSAITAMSGKLKIPVLKPVQIRIDIPTPPNPGKLAELPPVADMRAAMDDAIGKMPTVKNDLALPPDLKPPEPLGDALLTSARLALWEVENLAYWLDERYNKFWTSIGPVVPGQEQFNRQIEFKTGLKCYDFDTLPCEHVEMDLRERGQLIGSRPLMHLAEDFDSVGTARMEPTNCLPEDDACHLLNAERTNPGFRWEVRGSGQNDAPIDELKLKILMLTQPPPLGTADPLLLAPHQDNPAPVQSFPSIRLLP